MEHEIRKLLGHRWTDILQARFYDGKSLGEIAASEGVSKQRIHQIERHALRKLRRDPLVRAASGFGSA